MQCGTRYDLSRGTVQNDISVLLGVIAEGRVIRVEYLLVPIFRRAPRLSLENADTSSAHPRDGEREAVDFLCSDHALNVPSGNGSGVTREVREDTD